MSLYMTIFEKTKLIAVLKRYFSEENSPENTDEVINQKINDILQGFKTSPMRLRRIYNFKTMEFDITKIRDLIIDPSKY